MTLFLFGVFNNALSQEERFEFVGALITSNNYKITLKLNFVVDKNGVVSGKSITDFYGENSTESKIEGKLDLKSNLLSFQEISNISTKSDADASTFCYIKVDNLPVTVQDEKNVIKGDFQGFFPNGDLCASGEIYVVGADILERLSSSDDSKEDTTETDTQNNDPITLKQLKKVINPNKQLSHSQSFTINWESKEVKLNVWDSYFEDHDKINIYVNDKLMFDNIEVRERKKSFELPFVDGKCTLKIEAVNVGLAPPNTVHASLIDGGVVWPFLTKLNKGEYALIEIVQSSK
jgi:hypothetical protein